MIDALRRAQDRLAALVGSLEPDDLTRPSYDDEWTIADVLSHGGSGADIFGASLDAGLAGRDEPGMDTFPEVWARWDAKSPQARATDSLAVNEAFVARLEGLSDAELAGIDLNLFGMEVDAPALARMRLSEQAVHTWDIAVVLDPDARIDAEPVALLMHTLPQLAQFTTKPDQWRGPRPFRIHLTARDPDDELALTIGDAVTLGPQSGAASDATITLPAEALLRLVYGRLDAEHTPAAEITAGGVDLDDLRPVFPGF
jgi:uncharacterized protein (TIGR03083 family)